MKTKMIDEMTIEEFLQWIIDNAPEGFGHSSLSHFLYELVDGAKFHSQAIAEHNKEMSSKSTNKLDNTHQQFQISGNGPIVWDVTKVPGGYIYSYIRFDCGQMMCCFVPYKPTKKGGEG